MSYTHDQSEQPGQEPQENSGIQDYKLIAGYLRSSLNSADAQNALGSFIQASEEEQLSFLKMLAKQQNREAADVSLAVHEFSPDKAVRKEARRTLIKLEGAKVYPDWTPPAAPTLSQALEYINASASEGEGDEEEESGLVPAEGDTSLLSELQSLISHSSGFFDSPEYANTVTEFLEAWAHGEYEDAYDLLATTSVLREGLTREEWVARRRAWNRSTHPGNMRITFITPFEQESESLVGVNVEGRVGMDVGWSLTYTPAPDAPALSELPGATAVFQETERRWFWSSYDVVEEDGEWRVAGLIDEGTKALHLPAAEIQQRLADIIAFASTFLDEDDDEDEDDDFEDEDDDEAEDKPGGKKQDEADEDEEEFEDEDEDEIDDEDDEDEEEFGETLGRLEVSIRLTTIAMHYNDALIAQFSASDLSPLNMAFDQAMSINEPERAAAYAQQVAEHFPDYRSEALCKLAVMYMEIGRTYLEEENEEQSQRFAALAERALRDAVVADPDSAQGPILLANMLIGEERELDEAEQLLRKAQTLTTKESDIVVIEAGLGEVALTRDDKVKALHHFQRVTELDPEDATVWLQVGALQSEMEQYVKAEQSLLRSVELDPEEAEAYSQLANVYMMQGNPTRARHILKQGLDIIPDSAELLAMLALIYMHGNDLRSAQKYLEQAEETDDESPVVQEVRRAFDMRRAQQRPAPKGKSSKQHKPRRK